MIRPVDAEISQRFGDNPTRNLPADSWLIKTFGNYQPDGHSGEDYACPIGTPVRAVTNGTVLHIGWMGGTYVDNPWWVAPGFAGYCAVIDHGSFIGIYGHCSDGSAKVTKGQRVTEGQVFILSGNTGGSTGPHLHFEILPDGWVLNSSFYGRIDPEPIFASMSYAGTVTTQSATTEEDIVASIEELTALLDSRVDELTKRTNSQHEETRKQDAAQHLETRQVVIDGTQAQSDVTRGYLADRVKESSPAEIAALIPDAIAQEVIDKLGARLAGGGK